MKLRRNHIYRSENNHIIIPVILHNNYYWHCKMFYNRGTCITDQGYYIYRTDGTCLEENSHYKDIKYKTPLKSLQINEQKVIKEWKNLYKKEDGYV